MADVARARTGPLVAGACPTTLYQVLDDLLAIVEHLLSTTGGSVDLRARAGGVTEAIVRLPIASGQRTVGQPQSSRQSR